MDIYVVLIIFHRIKATDSRETLHKVSSFQVLCFKQIHHDPRTCHTCWPIIQVFFNIGILCEQNIHEHTSSRDNGTMSHTLQYPSLRVQKAKPYILIPIHGLAPSQNPQIQNPKKMLGWIYSHLYDSNAAAPRNLICCTLTLPGNNQLLSQ